VRNLVNITLNRNQWVILINSNSNLPFRDKKLRVPKMKLMILDLKVKSTKLSVTYMNKKKLLLKKRTTLTDAMMNCNRGILSKTLTK